MNKIILVLLIGFSGFAQLKHTETDFFLENKKIYWQHIYEVPGKNTEELIKYFQKEVLTNIKQDNFQIIDNTISFTIKDDTVDFRKYGGTLMGTVMFAQSYLTYLVIIDFKEDKYRVTTKEIFLDNKNFMARMTGYLEEYIARKKNTEFTTNSLAIKGIIYFHKHFLEKFENKPNELNKKDW